MLRTVGLTILALLSAVPAWAWARPRCVSPVPAVVQEVERLLDVAASHMSGDEGCSQAEPARATIDEIRVCARGARALEVSYRLTRIAAGAPPPAPRVSRRRVVLRLVGPRAALRLVAPARVPGMTKADTPLEREHDGGCEGPAAAFAPQAIDLTAPPEDPEAVCRSDADCQLVSRASLGCCAPCDEPQAMTKAERVQTERSCGLHHGGETCAPEVERDDCPRFEPSAWRAACVNARCARVRR